MHHHIFVLFSGLTTTDHTIMYNSLSDISPCTNRSVHLSIFCFLQPLRYILNEMFFLDKRICELWLMRNMSTEMSDLCILCLFCSFPNIVKCSYTIANFWKACIQTFKMDLEFVQVPLSKLKTPMKFYCRIKGINQESIGKRV